MKSTSYQTGRFGVWAVTGLTLLLSHLAVLAQSTFSNNSGITIRDFNTAQPYPSVITSSGLTGQVEKVTVTFTGLTHGFPDDIDALLIGQNTTLPATPLKSMLMSDAGGGGPGLGITNYTLTFDDAAAANLPDNTLISPGTYKPTDYEASSTEMSGQPGPYGTSLSVFNAFGTNPNATWSLYVQDDTVQDAGTMAGWSIQIWTAPVITNQVSPNTLPDLVMGEDTTATVDIKGVDSDTPAANLTFTASSGSGAGNATIPNAGLTYGPVTALAGGGFVRTLSIHPAANLFGAAIPITVTVGDGLATVTATFNLTVTNINDAPTLALGATSTTIAAGGVSTNISVTVAEPGNDPNATATLTATSSNESIVSGTNVFFTPSPGGAVTSAGQVRVMNITPNGGASGTVTLTVTDTDDAGATATQNITVTVNPPASTTQLFSNTNKITIADAANASPFPSTIVVGGVVGAVGRVTVTLADLNHPRPSDVNVLLVGPDGTKVLLMSHAGDSVPVVNGRLVIDQTAAAPLPAGTSLQPNSTAPSTTTSYTTATNQPGSYGPQPAFSGVTGPYSTSLAAFNGLVNPNGTWSLYVLDDAAGNAGSLNDGWNLTIKAAPTIGAIPNQTIAEDTSTNLNFIVADQDGTISSTGVTATSGNTTVIPTPTVTGSGNNRTVTITPAPNQPAGITPAPAVVPITITATDNDGNITTTTFNVTVVPVNDAPTITPIGKQTTTAGVPIGPIPFTVADIDNAISSLNINATSSNTKVIPNENIVFSIDPSTGNDTVTLYPAGGQSDTNILITISVSDGSATTTEAFLVNVLPAANPQFANFNGIAINDNASAVPYPSTVTVSGLTGKVSHVSVSLYGITHPTPVDISVLLVGPTGANVVVLSDAGGNNALTGEIMIFDDSAPGLAPQSSQIADGTYKPTNYEVDSAEFAGVAGPYGSALSVFNGTVANGTWSLYVIDDKAGGRGQITGWTLDIQTAPVLSTIPDTHVAENNPATIRFTVGDEQSSSISNWTVTATSSDPSKVSPSGFAFSANSGANRTLVITPVQNAFGTTAITITAKDQYNNTASTSFNLIIDHVNQLPVISPIADQTIPAGRDFGPVGFTVSDVETADPSTISVTGFSSDQTILKNANIFFGGSGGSRTISAIPEAAASGRVTISIVATDTEGGKSTNSFTLTISSGPVFANTAAITINDNTTATPYPSAITVANVGGVVGKITVTVMGLSHNFPDDIDMVLQGPGGTNIVLMSDAGGGNPVSNVRLIFTDSASNPLPDEGQITSGTWRPSNYTSSPPDFFPSPGPGLVTTANSTSVLADLNGSNPNGTWQLFIVDDTFPDGGSLAGGWMLAFETKPLIAPIADQTIPEDTQIQIPFTITDSDTPAANLLVSVTTTNTTPLFPPANIVITGTGNTRTLTLLGATNLSGSDKITLSVTDGTYTTATSFNIVVTPVNDPSTFVAPLPANQTTAEDTVIADIPFTINDVDTPQEKLLVTISSSNPTVVSNTAAQLTVTGTNSTGIGTMNGHLKLTPNLNANGTTTITITVTDTSDANARPVSTSFVVTVTPVNDAPTISLSSATTSARVGASTAPVTVSIADVDDDVNTLTVTATSQNTAAIPQASISLTGSGSTRTLIVNPIATPTPPGGVNIIVAVSDGKASPVTATLNVTITATGLVFGNNALITINDSTTPPTAASPYPSTITVAPALRGTIGKVTVSLNNINHPNPDDIDVLLVGPNGGKSILMSDVGGSSSVANLRLVLDDTAGAALPDSGQLTSGTYTPTDFEPGDTFLGPAPAGPYGASLGGAFNGASPNGTWSLYVVDDKATGAGTIAEGWFLTITPNPFFDPATPFTTQTRLEDQTTPTIVNFRVGDENTGINLANLVVDAIPANPSLATVRVTGPDSSGNVTLTINGNQPDANGTTAITVVVRDTVTAAPAVLQATASFNLVVTAVDDPPTVAGLSSQTIAEDTQYTVKFTVTDVDTALSNITLRATSSNPALADSSATISGTNVVFAGSGTNSLKLTGSSPGTASVVLTVTPKPDAFGVTTITVTASDLSSTTTVPITLTVTNVNDAPTISLGTSFVAVASGATTAPISITVADVDNDVNTLTLTASSSDRTTIPTNNIVFSGTGANRSMTITAAPNQTNLVTITITVSDGNLTSSANLSVLVTPTLNRVFNNGDGAITIPSVGAASPYPSITSVTGLGGIVTKVTVTLNKLTHTFPDDLDIILVSPSGKKAMVMSDAGGGGVNTANSVTNITVTLDDSAASAVPDSGPLTSGTYKPTDYNDGTDSFPGSAPAGPYPASFTQFNGDAPNGNWSLYIVDDTAPDSGSLGGWTLTLQTAPVVTGLPATTTTVDEDTAVSFPISVNDETNPAHSYTFTNSTSSATGVVPNANIVVTPRDATGTNFTVTVRAVGPGTTTISLVTTRQDDRASAANTFVLTFTPVNDAPSVNTLADTTVSQGTPLFISLITTDDETPNNLRFAATSSNTALLPVSNIIVSGGPTNYLLTVTPVATQTGTSIVSIAVSDPQGATTTRSFTLTVTPDPNVFANTAAIVIRDSATPPTTANPYPSSLTVAGITGRVTRVTVTLVGVTHRIPADIDALLVGPQGQEMVLLSDAGVDSRSTLNNSTLVFDDLASGFVPQTGVISSGVYKPTDYVDEVDSWPGAPAGTHASALSTFAATNPNGVWSLYIVDDTSGEAGQIAGGWVLKVISDQPPTISSSPNLVITHDTSVNVPFTIGDADTAIDTLQVSAASSNQDLVPTGNIVLSGSGANRTASITPLAGKVGTTTITLTVADATTAVSSSFLLSVTNLTPIISQISDTPIGKSQSTTIPFTVSDPDTSVTNLQVTATSSSQAIIPTNNIVISGTGTNRSVTITPTPGATGAVIITLTVNDGNSSAVSSFIVTVTDRNASPTISPIADLTIPENSATSFVFTIADAETAPDSLIVGATSSNTNLVSRITTNQVAPGTISFGGGGNNRFAIITPATNTFGTSIINVTVSDGTNTSTSGFILTVTFVNQLPTLTAIPNQTTQENKPLVVPVSGSDVETASSNLVFTATSANTNIATVTVTGTPANPSVTVTPAQNQTGSATITVTVTDANGGSASQSFQISITPVNQPPTIGGFSDITVNESAAPVPSTSETFFVNDVDSPVSNLTFTVSSSNPTLLPKANIVISGTGTNRTIKVTPAAVQSGVSIVTVTVSDGSLNSSAGFVVTVNPVVFTPKFVGIVDQYTTSDSKPVVISFSISDPGSSPTNLTLSGTSSNPALLPNSGIVFAFNPTTSTRTLTLTPVTNVVGTTIVNLTVSDGTNQSSTGFILSVNSIQPPTITPITDKSTPQDTAISVPFTIADPDTPLSALTVTATSSNTNVVSKDHIKFTGTGNNRVAIVIPSLTPTLTQPASTIINLTVSDGRLTSSSGFVLTVTPLPHAPTISALTNETLAAGATARQNFTVNDVDANQDPNALTVTASSSNQTLVPAQNVVLAGTGTNRSIFVTTQGGTNSGSSTITLTVTDSTGLSTSGSFIVTVNPSGGAPATLKVTRISNTQVRLTLTGTPNAQYAIEGSTDLKNWTQVTTVTADASGSITFTDTMTTARFYRARSL